MSRATGTSTLDCAKFRAKLLPICEGLALSFGRDADKFARKAALASRALPQSLRTALNEFRLRGNRDGYLLLRGMPFTDGGSCESCLALVGSRLGDLAGYAQEKGGALFHDVVPEKAEEREHSAASSRVRLKLHTERCFHPYMPSHVLLGCLRPDPAGKGLTEVAGARRLLPRVAARHLPVLFELRFRTGIDYSFGNIATRKGNGPVLPVLYGSPDDPFLRYDLDLMVGLDSRARGALAAVKRATLRACVGISLRPGDLPVIDNRRAVHGRSAFRAAYAGRDRWLKRAYLVSDLSAIPDRLPGSRVVQTRFGADVSRRAPR